VRLLGDRPSPPQPPHRAREGGCLVRLVRIQKLSRPLSKLTGHRFGDFAHAHRTSGRTRP